MLYYLSYIVVGFVLLYAVKRYAGQTLAGRVCTKILFYAFIVCQTFFWCIAKLAKVTFPKDKLTERLNRWQSESSRFLVEKQIFICPYCFQKADHNNIWFQCSNPVCTEQDKIRTEFEDCRPLSGTETARVFQRVFPIPATNPILRHFGVENPMQAECETCHCTTSTQVCPHCHSLYPQRVDGLSNSIIAIIGAKETGKSHYVAVLIQQIFEIHQIFGWSMQPLDDETMNRYETDFYKPLYERNQVIPPTQKAAATGSNRKPLLYSLNIEKNGVFRTMILAFFDTAGEDMDNEIEMLRYNSYIHNAAGIILLLDPLQQKGLRDKLPDQQRETLSKTLQNDENTKASHIISRTVNSIMTKSSRRKQIDIPLAVAFSKMDEFREVLGNDAPIYSPSQHKGHFNKAEFDAINEYVRGWVGNFDPQFMNTTKLFKDAAFFGVSALGGRPEQTKNNQQLKNPPRPERVEDPLLWLLWKSHFIE